MKSILIKKNALHHNISSKSEVLKIDATMEQSNSK